MHGSHAKLTNLSNSHIPPACQIVPRLRFLVFLILPCPSFLLVPLWFRLFHRLPSVASKELQVDLKDSLEQTHVGSVVETYLVLPQVDNQNFSGGH